MLTTDPIKIGDKVNCAFAYNRKCSHRFDKIYSNNANEPWKLEPAKANFTGHIVGHRWVIMSDFNPHYGGGYGEDYEQGYVTGKTEKVLLVTESMKHEPFIVRYADAVLVNF